MSKKFKIKLPPKNNFISKFIELVRHRTDAYQEYAFGASLSILSHIAQRKIYIPLTPHGYFTNLWIMLVGTSTISRKSTIIALTKEILNRAEVGRILPEDFSPEGFIDGLARFPQGIFIRDEIGAFVRSLDRQYKLGLLEIFCELYNCPERYERRLRRQVINLEDVYLSILGATTPTSLVTSEPERMIESGFYPRFLFIFPDYKKKRKNIDYLREKDVNEMEELVQWVREINRFLGNSGVIYFVPVEDALKEYNKWQTKFENWIQNQENQEELSIIYGRVSEAALKISALIKLANLSIHEIHNIYQSRNLGCANSVNPAIYIEKSFMKLALYAATNLFFTHGVKVMKLIEMNAGDVKKVYELAVKYARNGKIPHKELLWRSHLPSSKFHEVINTLEEAGRLKKVETERGTVYEIVKSAELKIPEIKPPRFRKTS